MNKKTEAVQIVRVIPYRNFKEKIIITKEYDHIAKMTIEDKYILVELKEETNND